MDIAGSIVGRCFGVGLQRKRVTQEFSALCELHNFTKMFSTAKVRRKRWQDKKKIPTAQLRRWGWVSTRGRSMGRPDEKIIIGKVIHRGQIVEVFLTGILS
jgi:hypothetical protein